MRLNGKQEILAYLGRNTRSKKTWRKVRASYAEAIWADPATGRLWAHSEALDAMARERCVPVTEFLSSRPMGAPVGEHGGSAKAPPHVEKMVSEIFPGLARPRKRGEG